jgi:UDP-glucose 4-epimerase
LRVLGDGRQEKSYLHVQDCISAVLTALERHWEDPGAYVYNVGTEETVIVDESVRIITEHLDVRPQIEHTGGRRGWVGDSPMIQLETARIRALGWRPQCDIEDAIVRTLDWLGDNEYIWRDAVKEGSPL